MLRLSTFFFRITASTLPRFTHLQQILWCELFCASFQSRKESELTNSWKRICGKCSHRPFVRKTQVLWLCLKLVSLYWSSNSQLVGMLIHSDTQICVWSMRFFHDDGAWIPSESNWLSIRDSPCFLYQTHKYIANAQSLDLRSRPLISRTRALITVEAERDSNLESWVINAWLAFDWQAGITFA